MPLINVRLIENVLAPGAVRALARGDLSLPV
jgi:hypothetical protein